MGAAKVLIVEDEYIIARAIRESLEQAGYRVVETVSSGEDAVYMALRYRPDVIVMDIKLSGFMDGVFAAQHIHARADIPVIYLTAHSDPNTLKRVIHSQAYGFLTKPFTPDGLKAAVEKALAQYQAKKGQAGDPTPGADNPPPS